MMRKQKRKRQKLVWLKCRCSGGKELTPHVHTKGQPRTNVRCRNCGNETLTTIGSWTGVLL